MAISALIRRLILSASLLFSILFLAACGQSADMANNDNIDPNGGDGEEEPEPPVQSAECFEPTEADFPASPANGDSRSGFSCAIKLKITDLDDIAEIPGDFGDDDYISFQVIEPTTVTGGEKYPLILEGHGFSGSRSTSGSANGTAGLTVPTQPMLDGGFGIISIDQAGHGETGGLIRVMDPDQEGRFLIAILDWAEDNIDWLAYGPTGGFTPGANEAEDTFTPNPLVGAIGPSYGGGYQLLLHTVDPSQRLDALVPQITWNDLSFSLFPGTVPKSAWGAALFAVGNTAGSEENRGNFDPFVQRTFTDALSTGRVSDGGLDYFRYHGMGRFCEPNERPFITNNGIGSNGDNGTATAAGDTEYNIDYPADQHPIRKVHAIFWQGMRDELFNFNEAYENYSCLQPLGGDVRLLSYQSGHNTLQIPVDAMTTSHPQNALVGTCGPYDPTDSALEFFKYYLKRDDETAGTGIHAKVNEQLPDGNSICMSLQGAAGGNARYIANDYIMIPKEDFPNGATNGIEFTDLSTTFVAGVTPASAATVMQINYDHSTHGDILAGIPSVEISIKSACAGGTLGNFVGDDIDLSGLNAACAPDATDPASIVTFIATVTSDDAGATWQVADNQILPVRGTTEGDETRTIELIGIGERLGENTLVGIQVMGISDHFPTQGSSNPGELANFPTLPIAIEGKAYMPFVKGDLYIDATDE